MRLPVFAEDRIMGTVSVIADELSNTHCFRGLNSTLYQRQNGFLPVLTRLAVGFEEEGPLTRFVDSPLKMVLPLP